ncbi:hypothetical protein CN914_11255 [Bacillus thuringiensis]|nr:hypothetical protein CN914_11255 [Bacillus thuringiensis]
MGLAKSFFPSFPSIEHASQQLHSFQLQEEFKPMGVAKGLFPSTHTMENATQLFNSFQQQEKERKNKGEDLINKTLKNCHYINSTFTLK